MHADTKETRRTGVIVRLLGQTINYMPDTYSRLGHSHTDSLVQHEAASTV